MAEPRALPAPIPGLPPAWSGFDLDTPEPSAVPLSHYLWILRRQRWKILAFVLACVITTLFISAQLTPIYESTVTVDIDRQIPSAIIGQDAARVPLNDADQFLATQVKLIQSRSVLRPVAERFHLLDADKDASDGASGKPDESGEYGPDLLKKLKVTRPPNTYLLLISYRSQQPKLAADVANAVARSYVEHTYNIRFQSSAVLADFMEKQLEELKLKMERSSAALAQFERELNVIDPEEKISILSARLLQLNTEYTKAQTDRVTKQIAWRSVAGGSLESAQVSTQGESLKTLSIQLNDARQKLADAAARFGPKNPEYRKVAVQVEEIERQLQQSRKNAAQRVAVEYDESVNRESMLQQAVAETKADFDRLNARSFEYQSLKRGAEADKSLYEELVRKIKEAGINAGFQNSSIRIADPAYVSRRPVFPNKVLNVFLAFLFSTLIAVGFAVMTDFMDSSVRDPEQVHSLFQADVLASLPLVKTWRRGFVAALAGGRGASAVPRAGENALADRTVGGFEEAVRTLRNSILLGSFERRLRSLMVTSASPFEGKTTTAVHLAIAHAQQKHKTLLIDCDMRRPGVHAKLGIHVENGLASILQNGTHWRETLVRLPGVDDLDILPAGASGRLAADLIGRRLPEILEEAAHDYDLTVVDSPPVLGFSEPLQLAVAVDGVLIVAKAGETSRKTVGSALTTLHRVRANILGLVLNQVTGNMSDSYRYAGYYGKYYRHYKAAQ